MEPITQLRSARMLASPYVVPLPHQAPTNDLNFDVAEATMSINESGVGGAPLLLIGPTGMGKTSELLRLIEGPFLWWARFFRSGADEVGNVAADYTDALLTVRDQIETDQAREQRWQEEQARGELGLEPENEADHIQLLTADVARAARRQGHTGLCVVFDDLDAYSTSDLALVVAAMNTARTAPVFAVGSTAATGPELANGPLDTFIWRSKQGLSAGQLAEVVQRPAEAIGVRWDPAAVAAVADFAGAGNPDAVSPGWAQLLINKVWERVQPVAGTVITADPVHQVRADVEQAVAR